MVIVARLINPAKNKGRKITMDVKKKSALMKKVFAKYAKQPGHWFYKVKHGGVPKKKRVANAGTKAGARKAVKTKRAKSILKKAAKKAVRTKKRLGIYPFGKKKRVANAGTKAGARKAVKTKRAKSILKKAAKKAVRTKKRLGIYPFKKKKRYSKKKNPEFAMIKAEQVLPKVQELVSISGFKLDLPHVGGTLVGLGDTAAVMAITEGLTENRWASLPVGFIGNIGFSELWKYIGWHDFARGQRVGGYIALGVKLIANAVVGFSGLGKVKPTGNVIDDIIKKIQTGDYLEAIKLPVWKGLGVDDMKMGLGVITKPYKRTWVNDPTLAGQAEEERRALSELKELKARERQANETLALYGGKGRGSSNLKDGRYLDQFENLI